MAREHIVDLDERYLDKMERLQDGGMSYLGAYERARHEQDEDDNFRTDVPDPFFDEGGFPPEVADRSEG